MLFIRNQKKNVSLHFKQGKAMQAFIPAAGLGTRLRPLTDHCPKAMIEIDGVPLLKIAIDNLIRHDNRLHRQSYMGSADFYF